ncbi:sigma-54-dependent Fis family transcriptional regulator [Marinobacter sp. M3C]|uniref:sigma-54-dependent Fis family transcriptional regulator n=1 Tax=unclassified Marinobacter TaxID=83889 RepID=UPI00200C1F88|nr:MULTISPECIES: sigma-54-dependent Fis family transcriptional regulator [unclassified Marinobacter]UQG54344.1 sigma-54-dependent Fis family transcriptional regulator [Marinobacter sp. M4C]UQG60252.1 sigma-54-dependent Fis family transcriptional regulator [Marinobacter sp. M3C]UQG63151.1 sigma-54-dependent Fis family transcriptional regulator [Marinobacter sp. M2C]UQG67429.1 sigma-54-dependent Fis family transcriptional regulator [Marinobacter sp. M1C]
MKNTEYENERSLVEQSWDRCIAWGLDHDFEPTPPAPGAAQVEELERQYHELLASTEAEVLPYYRNVLSSSRCLILLANRHATVLKSWGDERITGAQLKPWFQQGSNWQEERCGTNAIGTAIAANKAVQIQRNEHFLKLNRSMIGSAAPIFDAHKQLVGVLSVFSDAYLPQAHTLGVVRLLAQSVDNRLLKRQFERDHFLLTLSTTADNFDSPWSGILICDDLGRVVASNQRADQLLSKTTVGVRLDDLFTTHRNHILGHPPQSALQLSTKNRVRLSAKVQRPTVAHVKSPAEDDLVVARQTKATQTNSADFSTLEYGDATVRRCAEQSLKVLERGVPVLITGETGVGKEVLVKALHQATQRREQALVAVNCAAIPPELVESELFGYEAGAFTGARAQGSLGFIRKAHKGILFLDEIGEMPLSAQSRLLRVLQERVVTPVGATDSIAVDILLITATNRAPALHVESGQLRADLYYRINGLCVELPALRDRTDKQKLVQHIYSQYRDPVQSEALSPRILAALTNHPWPGNIRQLVNVVRVAVAIADGEDLQIWHLPADFLAQLDPTATGNLSDAVNAAIGESRLEATLGRLKKTAPEPLSHTLQVYQKCMGNISSAARELSISRNTLYKRLRELGVR